MKNPDEDNAYGLWKQKQIDSDPWRESWERHLNGPKALIGSALKDADKIAKFERTDPNPRIPFVEQEPLKFPWPEFLTATFAGGLCLWLAYKIAEMAGK